MLERIPNSTIPRNGGPYLRRYYLIGGDGRGHAYGFLAKLPFNLFLHHFVAGDDTLELHNHPYGWSVSWILKGGYFEERRYGTEVYSRILRPGYLNFIGANTFHRVDLLQPDCGAWTLFLTGNKVQSWGFWDRFTFKYRNASGVTR